MSKKGVSEITSYVLLILIAIAIAVLVFVFLYAFIPKAKPECKDGIELAIRNVACDSDAKELYLNLENRGLFTIDEVFIRIGESGKKYKTLIVKDPNDPKKSTWSITLDPQKLTEVRTYPLPPGYGSASSSYIIEVQPVHITDDKKSFAICPTISQTVLCAPDSGIECIGPGCEPPPDCKGPGCGELPPPPEIDGDKAVCGKNGKETGEECDNGINNGKVCSAACKSTCTYCSSQCKWVTVQGQYCGDGEVNCNINNNNFLRGDVNADGVVDISDPIYLNLHLNKIPGYSPLSCRDAADIDDSGRVEDADLAHLIESDYGRSLGWLFTGQVTTIPLPGPYNVGPDPTTDSLTCGGVVQEQCDGKAGVIAGRTCTSECKLIPTSEPTPSPSPAACGDGIINQASENCDQGSNNKETCAARYDKTCEFCSKKTCQWTSIKGPYCGDGKKDVFVDNKNFRRGDVNADGVVDISDPIYLNLHLKGISGYSLSCQDAADIDDNERIEDADLTRLLKSDYGQSLGWLYLGTPTKIPPPGPYNAGPDPTTTTNRLGCSPTLKGEECDKTDGVIAGYTCNSLCKLTVASAEGSPSPSP